MHCIGQSLTPALRGHRYPVPADRNETAVPAGPTGRTACAAVFIQLRHQLLDVANLNALSMQVTDYIDQIVADSL